MARGERWAALVLHLSCPEKGISQGDTGGGWRCFVTCSRHPRTTWRKTEVAFGLEWPGEGTRPWE